MNSHYIVSPLNCIALGSALGVILLVLTLTYLIRASRRRYLRPCPACNHPMGRHEHPGVPRVNCEAIVKSRSNIVISSKGLHQRNIVKCQCDIKRSALKTHFQILAEEARRPKP